MKGLMHDYIESDDIEESKGVDTKSHLCRCV